eukprot:GILI01014806.1.p1 GENE.GILI01014806.1~~GILI01014806.1.p1  ORF type:complete len:592 (+),score=62.37 GILI01014806.1:98-1873(+)
MLENLSHDANRIIFSFLDLRDIILSSQVCKGWNDQLPLFVQSISISSRVLLSDTVLKSVLKFISKPNSLQQLKIVRQKFTEFSLDMFLRALEFCPKIHSLHLSGNGLKTELLAPVLQAVRKNCPLISTLRIESNRVTAVNTSVLSCHLPAMPHLKVLSLNANLISPAMFATALQRLPQLTELLLSGMWMDSDGASEMLTALRVCTDLQTLNLDSSSIGPKAGAVLAETLQVLPKMETLRLAGCNLNSEGLTTVCTSVSRNCPKLKSLGLEKNCPQDLQESALEALSAVIKSCPLIEFLNIGEIPLGQQGLVSIGQAFESLPHPASVRHLLMFSCVSELTDPHCLSFLRKCPNLISLEMDFNKIGDAGMKVVCDSLIAPELTNLSIQSIGITSRGFAMLGELLNGLPKLTYLRAESNSMEGEEAEVFVANLTKCPQLDSLLISENALASNLPTLLGRQLMSLPLLHTLAVNGCGLSGERIIQFCSELQGHPTMRRFSVRDNRFHTDGALALCQMLPTLPCLEEALVGYNSFGLEGAKALASVIPHCRTLRNLEWASCNMTPAGKELVKEACLQHPLLRVRHEPAKFKTAFIS